MTGFAGWTVTVNGKKPGPQNASDFPQFEVRPGQKLTIVVTIAVPGQVAMTQLFLGITGDSSGLGPRGPIGMEPVLKTAENVPPGPHRFTLHWTMPASTAARAGYYLAMAQYWPKTAQEPQALELPEDAVALGPWGASAIPLRGVVLHTVVVG
jgi:hypothetical protein